MATLRIAMLGLAAVAANACTSENEDPFATGVKVPCCSGLEMELKNWDGEGRWFYRCTTGPSPAPEPTRNETIVLRSQETGLCLEPAGALEGVCSFHDTGLDFKQSLRFAECIEGSVDQEWIVERVRDGWLGEMVHLRPAKYQQYCMTVPGPYYGSVIDPKNHGDFEVWLCQCGQAQVLDSESEYFLVWTGTVLKYSNDSDSYIIGYNEHKMSLCFDAGGDPNPNSPRCEGTHWLSAFPGTSGDADDGVASSKFVI